MQQCRYRKFYDPGYLDSKSLKLRIITKREDNFPLPGSDKRVLTEEKEERDTSPDETSSAGW